MCVPDVIKKIIVKVFSLTSKTNETRQMEWHDTCKCKCRLDASVCNNKQRIINAGVNAKSQLIKVYVIRDLFGILVIVNVNAINNVIILNI